MIDIDAGRGGQRLGRILYNLVTLSDTARLYPKKLRRLVLQSTLSYPLAHWMYRRRRLSHAYVEPLTSSKGKYTRFFRNRPMLQALIFLLRQQNREHLRVLSVGCSSGAEIYSLLWTLSQSGSATELECTGIDISNEQINRAREAEFGEGDSEIRPRFGNHLNEGELRGLFVRSGTKLRIRETFRRRTKWRLGDIRSLDHEPWTSYDIVLANNILCHLPDDTAFKVLTSIARLVSANGYLVVEGVDLDTTVKVLNKFDFVPVRYMAEEVYDANRGARYAWPFTHWSMEPLNKRRSNWLMRYAVIYQAPDSFRDSAS